MTVELYLLSEHINENFVCGFMWQLVLAPILSAIHLYSVVQEMRAAPINTLNSQRTAMLVADYVKVCPSNSEFIVLFSSKIW